MRLSIEERILLAFARRPEDPEIGATASYTIDNCLDFPLKTVPDLLGRIRGKRVLDYGCGPGWQSVAMKLKGADEVLGLDINPTWLAQGQRLAEEHGVAGSVRFTSDIPGELTGGFDVVISISAFEHFADPEREVRNMARMVTAGGTLIVTFAEPWYSHSGSHIGNYTRIPGTNLAIPWCGLFFSDRALLTLRSRFRADRPSRLEDIEGGLNRMSLARFERIIRASGLAVEEVRYHATLGLPLVTRIPGLRELLTSAATCVLRSPNYSKAP